MINCFQFYFNFAGKFHLRHYTLDIAFGNGSVGNLSNLGGPGGSPSGRFSQDVTPRQSLDTSKQAPAESGVEYPHRPLTPGTLGLEDAEAGAYARPLLSST
jgi:hypothetical protein